MGAAVAAIPASERQALVELFDSMGGNKWRNGTGVAGRWLQGDPCENRWYGVTCNANESHVTELFPSQVGSGNSLSGTIPASIGNLSGLQHLVLSNAFTHEGALVGTIPESLANLRALRCVYFSHSRLAGTIPASFNQLTRMQGFFMRDNRLSGRVPDVSRWSDLRSVDLDSNKALTGNLSNFAELRKLVVLVMHNMGLSGELPDSLCSIFECDAHANEFQCPLPAPPREGTACCGVTKCTNGSSTVSMHPPPQQAVSAAVINYSQTRRTPLQADPGDNRPYGPGYTCHCHTPTPRKPPQ
jgi:hypothetical protein